MQLLNKIPVLDKGHVALYSTSLSNALFNEVLYRYFRNTIDSRILNLTNIVLHIKCPLFVQLSFAEHGLISYTERAGGQVEAYIPMVNDIDAATLEDSVSIQQDIEQTTKALLLNPQSYQMDNCNVFISQVISPISIYNTLLVQGTLASWIRYVEQVGLPKPIDSYRKAIEDCLCSEWDKVINDLRSKSGKKR